MRWRSEERHPADRCSSTGGLMTQDRRRRWDSTIRNRPWMAATWIATICVAAIGCGATGDGDDDAPTVPFATVDWGPGEPGMQALAHGTLVLVNGCVYLDGTIPIFPIQTSWTEATQEITLGDQSVHIGKQVGLVGGFIQDPPTATRIPSSCQSKAEDQSFFQVNGSSFRK